MQAEIEAIPPPLIYSLNPLEPRLPSGTRTTNPIPLRNSSKSISKLIALLFPYQLRLFSTTRLYQDSKYLARRTPNYATTSRHAIQLLFLQMILFLPGRKVKP
jgi:hypothetical protein